MSALGFTVKAYGETVTTVGTAGLSSAEAERLVEEYKSLGYTVVEEY